MKRILRLALAAAFGTASVVEWAHVRQAYDSGNWVAIVGAGIAAIALGYIAGEAAVGKWP